MKRAPRARPDNLLTLREVLGVAQREGYAVGSFSPRYPRMIEPILRAAQDHASPVIVQISHKDMTRCRVDLEAFAEAFYGALRSEGTAVPVVLHLDHTHDAGMIERAIDAGFTSVMIDASDRPLDDNVALTRAIVAMGHDRGVSVEGEIGTLGAYAFSETDETSESSLTDPVEAGRFADESGVDAMAVSIGTKHGTKDGDSVTLDIPRLAAIRARTSVPLVLHGGSGVPADVLAAAIAVPGGGVSKVNVATDLERAMLAALAHPQRMVDEEIEALAADVLAAARESVQRVTSEKMRSFLLSAGRARRREVGP
jgi:ketose-bisphosphate aldolase